MTSVTTVCYPVQYTSEWMTDEGKSENNKKKIQYFDYNDIFFYLPISWTLLLVTNCNLKPPYIIRQW